MDLMQYIITIIFLFLPEMSAPGEKWQVVQRKGGNRRVARHQGINPVASPSLPGCMVACSVRAIPRGSGLREDLSSMTQTLSIEVPGLSTNPNQTNENITEYDWCGIGTCECDRNWMQIPKRIFDLERIWEGAEDWRGFGHGFEAFGEDS